MKRRIWLYFLVIIFMLWISWEYEQEVSASLLEASFLSEEQIIPEQSLRLRVLANSDHPRDQWLKQEVRDGVIREVSEWLADVDSLERAEEELQQSLPQIEQVVQQVLSKRGADYPFSVEYGSILFPAKLYGQEYYPAGEYQGLLITLGAGQGDNWWCVLFPPLCFVDFGTGEVIDPDQEFADEKGQKDHEAANKESTATGQEVEVRFFLVEWLLKIKSLFV